MKSSGGESGCPRKCGEATDSGGSGSDRNSDDTMQGSRPVAMVKVPPPERQSSLMRAAVKAAKVMEGWSDSKRKYAARVTGASALLNNET